MASFYLLLTTGMFVCILHCTAEHLLTKPAPMAMAMEHCQKQAAKKHCQNSKDCDCCKKHGSYVVKENIKPGFEFRALQATVALQPAFLSDLIFSATQKVNNTAWADSNAPPGLSGQRKVIRFRSLLI